MDQSKGCTHLDIWEAAQHVYANGLIGVDKYLQEKHKWENRKDVKSYNCDIDFKNIRALMVNGNNRNAAQLLIRGVKSKPGKLARRFAAFIGSAIENEQPIDVDHHVMVLEIAENLLTE